jgi:hypothetical protein
MRSTNKQTTTKPQASPKTENFIKKNFNFSKFCSEILEEINLVRVSPKDYIKKLKTLKFSENLLSFKDLPLKSNKLKVTQEGENENTILLTEVPLASAAVDELLDYLKHLSPMHSLCAIPALEKTAEDFIQVLQMHDGSDDNIIVKNIEEFMKRIKKYGTPHGVLGESIDYGTTSSELLVLKLLLDDGDSNRTDRNIMLSRDLKFCGIASGYLPTTERTVTILDFCENFYNLGERIPKTVLAGGNTRITTSLTPTATYIPQGGVKNVSSHTQGNFRTQTFKPQHKELSSSTGLAGAFQYQKYVSGPITGNYQQFRPDNINVGIEEYETAPVNSNAVFEGRRENRTKSGQAANPVFNKIDPQKLQSSNTLITRAKSQKNINTDTYKSQTQDNFYSGGKGDLNYSYVGGGEKNASFRFTPTSSEVNTPFRKQDSTKSNGQERPSGGQKNVHFGSNTYNTFNQSKSYTGNPQKSLENDENIECINCNKKLIFENGVEKYLVKKTIYYVDGSTDEWVYKENKY